MLLAICLAAVGVRAAAIIQSPSMQHPDEVFQYLKQAHRLRTGAGLVTWACVVGARSWLLPAVASGVMTTGSPFVAAPSAPLAAVAILLCLMSLCSVVCGYRWGRRAAGLAGGVTAGLRLRLRGDDNWCSVPLHA
ncbi:MAG: mannosyltransferase, partial [Proteobacteria bacterium]|nr:mannosyltransferase [Pseudomonadota bacterium]